MIVGSIGGGLKDDIWDEWENNANNFNCVIRLQKIKNSVIKWRILLKEEEMKKFAEGGEEDRMFWRETLLLEIYEDLPLKF